MLIIEKLECKIATIGAITAIQGDLLDLVITTATTPYR